MDVAHPIAAAVPTLDGPILEVLARTVRPLTGREVHRLADIGSESGIRLALGRLVEQGLVMATRAGQATLYAGNRDHLAWPAVEVLAGLRQRLFDRLRETVDAWDTRPVTVAVFGSTARGDGDATSDIDVLIVYQDADRAGWEDRIDVLREQVAAWTGNTCQVYALTTAEYDQHVRSGEPIVAEWRRDAVIISGMPLSKALAFARGAA